MGSSEHLTNFSQISINTQSSTHWDGPRHMPYLEGRQFYNHFTQNDISGQYNNTNIGIQSMCNHRNSQQSRAN